MSSEFKILVVDDDADMLFAVTRPLKKAGFEILEASTGAECMTLASEEQPDLILLDVVLPDIEGTTLCQQIKADPAMKHIFIILLSGQRTSPDEQADGLDVGADSYLVKPVNARELLSRVNAMIRIMKAERVRDQVIMELEEALAQVKKLSGLLPICQHCKKIRDDQGYWSQIEEYVKDHSEAQFSHSICRDCANSLYPEMGLYDE